VPKNQPFFFGWGSFLTKYLAIVNHVLVTFSKDVEMQPCMQIDLDLTIKIRSSKLVECGCHNWLFFSLGRDNDFVVPKILWPLPSYLVNDFDVGESTNNYYFESFEK
jgi:hypothetical protein